MSGFIAAEPAATDPADEIESGAFWPSVSVADLRETVRLDGTVTEARLRHATVDAIGSINRELAAWKDRQIDAGHATLNDVPAETIGGQSQLVGLYLRAVYATASAHLRERYRDFDSTGDGHQAADKLESPIDDLRRDARWAVRDILGVTRSTVELI